MPSVPKPKHTRRPHFFRQWRKHRGYTLEKAAEVIGVGRTTLGRMEKGEVPYDQDWLEITAEAYQCSPADLLMRNPLDTEAPWSIWDRLKPEQRKQAVRLLVALAGDEEKAA